jgi:hypothetical protein
MPTYRRRFFDRADNNAHGGFIFLVAGVLNDGDLKLR